MKVSVSFPLSSDGPLGRAAAVAARHDSYRVEGANGMARAAVDLDLPADWRILDDFSGMLRGEFSEENALRLAQLGAGVPVQEIQLEDDEVVLKMAVGLGSPATVRGRLYLQDGSLIFEPRQIEGGTGSSVAPIAIR